MEESDARADAMRMEQQLTAALQSTSHLGAPNAFRTAISFDVLHQITSKYGRFDGVMGILQKEMSRAVFVTLPTQVETSHKDDVGDRDDHQQIQAERVQRFFARQTFFTQLQQVLEKKANLQSQLDGLDVMHALMLTQLRHEERMVEKIASRWARVLLKQTLVDWRKIIVRKKYTRVLLEKTSARWRKQRLLHKFRRWSQYATASKVARVRELIQQCSDQTRDLEEMVTKMEAQIVTAKTETRAHREHFDFAKRQILSLEELLAQLEKRVHGSKERQLQAIANEWGILCLSLVDCQVEFLQNMLDSVPLDEYADPSLLLVKGEELSDLLRLPADVLVLRWINFHLSKSTTFQYYCEASSVGLIQNFSTDMKNQYALRHILQRVLDQAERVAALACEAASASISEPASRAGAHSTTPSTPFASKLELRCALEERLRPACPPFLSAQVLEHEIPSDLAFALFAFLVCEHPSLLPSVLPEGGPTKSKPLTDGACVVCPWREAQLALVHAQSLWTGIRTQWTELQTPFAIRELAPSAPDMTSPPHLLVRANIALQNAVDMVQYACAKRGVAMKVWACLRRTVQQDALRVLVQRGRQPQQPPWEMIDRRLWREKVMLTTLQVPKLLAALSGDSEAHGGDSAAALEAELLVIECILKEYYDELRRVYRYYAGIDAELQRTDHLLRHHHRAIQSRDAQDEERFFRKIALSMSLVEFYVFLKDCRVFGTARPFPYVFIERVFEHVNREIAVPTNELSVWHDDSLSEMTPAEFVEALVHIAHSKHWRGSRHAATSTALSQRFRRMLVDVVLPHAMQEAERVNVFQEQLVTTPCRDVLVKHQTRLQALYARFAELAAVDSSTASNFAAKHRKMLSVHGLVALLKHFQLLREHFLNLDDVQHILSQVLLLERDGIQLDLQVVALCLARLNDEIDPEILAEEPRSGQWPVAENVLLITYSEFLQVIAAVACYLRPDAFVPLANKLHDFFTDELQFQSAPLLQHPQHPHAIARDKI
jgi:hypothetical protein